MFIEIGLVVSHYKKTYFLQKGFYCIEESIKNSFDLVYFNSHTTC